MEALHEQRLGHNEELTQLNVCLIMSIFYAAVCSVSTRRSGAFQQQDVGAVCVKLWHCALLQSEQNSTALRC